MVACALRLLPAVSGSGVRCGRACWGLGFGCAPPLLGGCWGVCVLVLPSRVVSCTSWLGVLCGGACLCARPACSSPFLAGVCCVGVRAWPRSRLCPALLGWVVGVCFFSFFLWACLALALWCRLLAVPVLGLVVPVPPSPLSRAGLLALFSFFFFFRVVCVCAFLCPFSWWAAVPGLVLPVLAGWYPCAPFGGPVPGQSGWGVWPPLVVWAAVLGPVGRPLAPPPPPLLVFFGGGVCLFLPLPSLGWRTHWPAFSVVFRVAVAGCVLLGRVPARLVGWAMYTLGSAPLPAGLGPGSASWAAAPGGFVWLWVIGLGLSVSFLLRSAGFNLLGGPPPLLPGTRWPLCVACGAGVWRAGAAPSGVCARLFRFVLQVRVSRAVLCRSVPRRVASSCGALHRGALR